MTITADKSDLRKQAAEARKAAHANVDPGPALASLGVVLSERAGRISFYWPIRTEIDPRPAVESLVGFRELCLPITDGRNPLTFRPWTPDTKLVPDGFGVPIPESGETVKPDVLIVPLLAFDSSLQRLGYGAGHYDRTLELLRAEKPVVAIGLAYSAQEIEAVPTEPTDQPLDMIITEAGVHRLR